MKLRRRAFLGSALAGLASGTVLGAPRRPNPAADRIRVRPGKADPIATARNLVFVLLEGAPSHVDTFDLKLDVDTPDFLGAQEMGGWIWPAGIMPMLAERADRFALVRSISAVEAVHERALYHLLTAHRLNAALIEEIPEMTGVLSHQLAGARGETDSLPTVMRVGSIGPGAGFFGVEHQGLILDEAGTVANLTHDFDGAERRMQLLDALIAETQGRFSDARADHLTNLTRAREMMRDDQLASLLGVSEEPYDGDGPTAVFQRQCETVVRVLEADKGTRVFQMVLSGWDHHDAIYDQNAPYALPGLARALDGGLAYLIDALSARPAAGGTGTLLDETLIVAVGEFGRTVGRLNTSAGRDHYPYAMPALFAGGGVRGGRVVGATGADGSFISDPGWSHNRYMTINDLSATIYSALGVDWTSRFEDTPSGRVYEVIDTSQTGPVYPIDGLFT